MNDVIDPRIINLARGRAPFDRFMIFAFAMNMPPEAIDAVFGELDPQGVDFARQVEGKPLMHWLGKSREQIGKEMDNDDERIENVLAQFQNSPHGQYAGEENVGRTQGEITEHRQNIGNAGPIAPPLKFLDAENNEPVFGKDQIPVSELFGKTDADLLEIEGIGKKTVNRIRELQAVKEQQASETENPPLEGGGGAPPANTGEPPAVNP